MGNNKQNAGSCFSCVGFIFIFLGAINMGVYMGPYTFPTVGAMMMGAVFAFTGFAFEMIGLVLLVMGKREGNTSSGERISTARIRRAQRNRTISDEFPQNGQTCNHCGSSALTDDSFCTNCHTYSLENRTSRPNIQPIAPLTSRVNGEILSCPNCNNPCTINDSFCVNCGRFLKD